MKFFIIHNKDPERKKIMLEEFKKIKLKEEDIVWINEPNRDDITDKMVEDLTIRTDSYSSGILIKKERCFDHRRIVSCTYKHYIALKQIVENNIDYGVIIEDSIEFKNINNIYEWLNLCINQLNEYDKNWDILFDNNWTTYIERPTNKRIFVYPKKNEITNQCAGGTKAATFYLLKLECAKKMVPVYLPFNNSPDWWMNDLFRKLNIKSFWVDPPKVHTRKNHISSFKLQGENSY